MGLLVLVRARNMGSELGFGRLIEQSLNNRYSSWIHEALDEFSDNFFITDPCISGHPIVFVSRGFLKMFGYSREEVIGRNGRLFQGPGTDSRSLMEIREAIREEKTIQTSLLNYRKDGTPIWILFHLSPVFAKEDGRVIHFVTVEVPILKKSNSGRVEDVLGAHSWSNRSCSGSAGTFSSSSSDCLRSDIVYGSCRRELYRDSGVEFNRALLFDSFFDSDNRGLQAEESCEASIHVKQTAADSASSILSTLSRCSELTGKLVCEKRCCSRDPHGIVPLGSSLIISLGRIKQSFVLTDPHLPNMPIVYASDAFLSLTGYSRTEVLGRNCRFLQGPDTNVEAVNQIRQSIQAERPCGVRILNYRKDSSLFWNLLHISPVRNASGKIAFYVGVQLDEDSVNDGQVLSPEMRQLGAVGAVKVAVRSLSGAGPSKSQGNTV
uniref:Putative LOV domain-containing protein n=1 Tax=Austrobaileya scandens TaxID=13351 RepID=A0A126WXD4_9MAGN|nr:putative LOV domain-containing protein [Austrobaileya scandens]